MRTDPSSLSSSEVLHFLEGRVEDRRGDRDFRGTVATLEFSLQAGLPGVDADSEGREHVSETGLATRLLGERLSSSPGTTMGSGIDDKPDVEEWSS
jgi:hypothetical protein